MRNKTRDFDDPEYKAWRRAVRKRDNYCCVLCGARSKLQVHHIKRWADYPALRYDVQNGCCLCGGCHKKLWGKEHLYEGILSNVISADSKRRVNKLLDEYDI